GGRPEIGTLGGASAMEWWGRCECFAEDRDARTAYRAAPAGNDLCRCAAERAGQECSKCIFGSGTAERAGVGAAAVERARTVTAHRRFHDRIDAAANRIGGRCVGSCDEAEERRAHYRAARERRVRTG